MNGNGKVLGPQPAQPEPTPEQTASMEKIRDAAECGFRALDGLTMSEGLSAIKTVEALLQAHIREVCNKELIKSGEDNL